MSPQTVTDDCGVRNKVCLFVRPQKRICNRERREKTDRDRDRGDTEREEECNGLGARST